MNFHGFIDWPSNTIFAAHWALPILFVLAIWELVWKAWGMWQAARNNQSGWYIAILLLNTLGILPILYIYVFGPKSADLKDRDGR